MSDERSPPKVPAIPRERILVVDDHEDILAVLSEVLALDGFDVCTARDGARALEAIAENLPLCVLTDVNMPGMDGFELASRLRKLYGSQLVLIAVTGFGDDADRASPDYAEFDHCLRKPIDLHLLRRILRPQ